MRAGLMAAVVVASLGLRAVYFAQLSGTPCLVQHRWADTDMHFFDEWARAIADGDWLGDRPLHPQHSWHRAAAREYLDRYPDAREAIAAEASSAGLTPSRALWNRWYGGKRFHQEPLYPYLVAGHYIAFGSSAGLTAVLCLQIVVGTLSLLLVGALARRLGGDLAAGAAVALGLLCAPLLYYDLILLRAPWIVFAGLGLAWLATRVLEEPTLRRSAVFGLAAGGAILLKSTLALYPLGVLAAIAWRARAQRRVVASGVAVLAGMALAVSPLVARNALVGAPLFGLSSVAAMSVVSANAADNVGRATGGLGSIHLSEIMHETQGDLLAVSIATLRTHDDPLSYLAGLAARVLDLFQPAELPNNASFAYYARHASVLNWLPVGFAGVAAPGLVGLLLCLRRRDGARSSGPLVLLLAVHALPMIFFGVYSRYRIPFTAALLPFAGFAVARFIELVRNRHAAAAAAWMTSVVGLGLGMFSARPPVAIRPADYEMPYQFYYGPLVAAALEAGQPDEAASILADSLRVAPPIVSQGEHKPANGREAEVMRFYAGIVDRYAGTLDMAGRVEKAARQRAFSQELHRRSRGL